jgi:hypothetical protein
MQLSIMPLYRPRFISGQLLFKSKKKILKESKFKGTVQQDESGRNYAHWIGRHLKREAQKFLEKSTRLPSSESPLKY